MSNSETNPALAALLNYTQADEDGVMVLVSRQAIHETADTIARLEREKAEAVLSFAKAVLHGDGVHKAWLLEAAQAWTEGKPLPPPRSAPAEKSEAFKAGMKRAAEICDAHSHIQFGLRDAAEDEGDEEKLILRHKGGKTAEVLARAILAEAEKVKP